MKKFLFIATISVVWSFTTTTVQAQGLLKKVQKAAKDVRTAKGVLTGAETQGGTSTKSDAEILKETLETSNTAEENNHTASKKNTTYTGAVGKISFFTGTTNPNADKNSGISTIDLAQPIAMNAYLEDAIYNIKAHHEKIGKYDHIAPAVLKKYYINGELITTYWDNIGHEAFKENKVLSDVIVPDDIYAFKQNEMRVGVLAHVFSALKAGTHKFKIEYYTAINTPLPNTTGSAATEYKNEELLLASGEVDLKIDANTLNQYCKAYGRPKFGKGVLAGQAALEADIKSLIQKKGHNPIYIYAEDNWKLYRNDFGVVTKRELLVYYVFTNDKGRCEAINFYVIQDNDNGKYYKVRESATQTSPMFKYVVCQNY